jgi:hypothetical protein
VLGVPDALQGEAVTALVHLREGAEGGGGGAALAPADAPAALRAFCLAELPKYKARPTQTRSQMPGGLAGPGPARSCSLPSAGARGRRGADAGRGAGRLARPRCGPACRAGAGRLVPSRGKGARRLPPPAAGRERHAPARAAARPPAPGTRRCRARGGCSGGRCRATRWAR